MANVDGKWSMTADTPMGKQSFELTVATEGESFKGAMSSPMGAQDVSGTVSGDTLTFAMQMEQPMKLTLDYSLTVTGDAIAGSVKAGAFGSSNITGTRA
jgi:hypothetical protein